LFKERFEDIKRVIRSRKWKDRQHNGQKKNKKQKEKKNDLQSDSQKTKD
jgi:hypothetical protein